MSKCIQVTENSIDKILENNIVFIEFCASWSKPCTMIAHIIEELAKDFDEKVVFAKANTDDLYDIPMRFKIRVVPTVIVFKNGEEVFRKQGNASKESFAEMINDAINI